MLFGAFRTIYLLVSYMSPYRVSISNVGIHIIF